MSGACAGASASFPARPSAICCRTRRRRSCAARAACWARAGAMVLGVDLKKDPRRLHDAYNDAAGVTAQFTLNLLRRMNRELDANFDLSGFAHEAFYNPVEGRIEIYFRSLRPRSSPSPAAASPSPRASGSIPSIPTSTTMPASSSWRAAQASPSPGPGPIRLACSPSSISCAPDQVPRSRQPASGLPRRRAIGRAGRVASLSGGRAIPVPDQCILNDSRTGKVAAGPKKLIQSLSI